MKTLNSISRSRKFIYSFLIMLLASYSASAQWTQVGYMVVNGTDTANGSHVIKGFGANVYCGTVKGLFKSTDNGSNWTNISFNAAVISGQDIFSVYQASNGSLFAGSNKRMFKSTDNGTTWSWMSGLPDSATYYDITEIGGNILATFAKGTTNGVYYSNDFGATWTQATGIASGVRYFLIEGSTVLVGGTSNGIYKSIDVGQTWSSFGTGFPAAPGIWDIKRSENKLFAGSITGLGLFESSDNGSTWTSSSPTVFNGFCQVFSMVQSGKTIILTNDGGGCNVGGASSIRSSTDGGNTWSSFMGGTTPPNYFSTVGKNSSGTSFFAKKGNGKETYRFNNGNVAISDGNMQNSIMVYPNPTIDYIHIQGVADIQSMEFEVVDMSGKTVIQAHKILSESAQLNVSSLAKGMYTITCTQAGQVQRLRFIKD